MTDTTDVFDAVLNVRVTSEMEQQLAALKATTLVPTAAFLRRLIKQELQRIAAGRPLPEPLAADKIERRNHTHAPVLFTTQKAGAPVTKQKR